MINKQTLNRIKIKDMMAAIKQEIEETFIKYKLGIKYFPSQGKKTITEKGGDKIVPIDYIYGSENA